MGFKGRKKFKLEDIVDFYDSKRVPLNSRERETRRGKYPYYGASGIVDYVDGYLFDGEYVLISEDGENLRSRSTPIAFKVNGKFWVNNHAHIVQGKELFLNDWIVYFFQNLDLNPYITGAVQPKLNRENLRLIDIFLPDFDKARKIVSILQTNQTLEAIAQAIYKEWFVDFRFPHSPQEGKCPPRQASPATPQEGKKCEMQDSELGPIPKGWRVVAFEEELEAERGLSYKGEGLATSGAVPMHNLNSVYEGGGYKFEGIKYYSGEHKEKHIVQPGDLIIANTEQGHKYLLIGYPAIVPYVFGEVGIYSHHIYRLRPRPHSYLTSDFLYQLLLRPEIREQVVGFANGTTVNMLKIEGLQKPKFVLPPRYLVSKFSDLAASIRLRQEENIKQSATLAAIRDALLPKLMSGEIEV